MKPYAPERGQMTWFQTDFLDNVSAKWSYLSSSTFDITDQGRNDKVVMNMLQRHDFFIKEW